MVDPDYDIAIAGGGPAGMVAGLLFARAGLRTIVVEKHADFLRDFRGDTVHPSTLRIFAELGLLERLLRVPHTRLDRLVGRVFGRTMTLVELGKLPVSAPFIAMMPQWDFLDFVAEEARRYPTFTLRQSCRAEAVIEEGGRVAGLRLQDGCAVRARLTIACDGRDSRLRAALDARTIIVGAPMDVFWFRLPKSGDAPADRLGTFEPGRLLVTIDRGDYLQCAYVFPKGQADALRAEGIARFRERVRGDDHDLAVGALHSFDEVKLLTVTVDRLDRWSRPGLLVIGDAAHAMSPIGGVGINLAIQDAVAAANILAASMAAGQDPDPLLERVAARRMFPTRVTQRFQQLAQDRIITPLLAGKSQRTTPPLAVRALDRLPLLRRIPGRLLGLGVRPEHVRSPQLIRPAPRP
jgi:2-polyprenyl-6-methoxyphenol hydroxylase-like FAD-dependent oxidoreductase